jgi:hypothetical protein
MCLMPKNSNQLKQLLSLIETVGIESAVNQTDIEAIEELSIKIILRTIQTSHENLIMELKEALS